MPGKRGLARRPAETLTAAAGASAILAIIFGVFPHMSEGAQKAVTAILTAVVALIPAVTSAIHDYLAEQQQIAEDMAYIREKLETEEEEEEEEGLGTPATEEEFAEEEDKPERAEEESG